ncbi:MULTISPECIES: hypothetical protein [unclassified Bradyrhizobium]|nr:MULTISPECIES: hypothetical protein [unclassified Bradyrhizobium]
MYKVYKAGFDLAIEHEQFKWQHRAPVQRAPTEKALLIADRFD